MSLRIIGGRYRGRRLYSLRGKATRPTPEIVREALFNILGEGVAGSRFLDLFAGTGAVGLEALSRGAARVTFVEKSPAAQAVLRRNLSLLDCEGRFRLLRLDAHVYQDVADEDFIFAAPPYPQIERMGRLGQYLACHAASEAVWILQHPKNYRINGIEQFWEMVETRTYGSNALSFFRLPKKAQPF